MGRSLLSGGRYFRGGGGGSLLSGFTSGHKKLTLISGGRYYRNSTVIRESLLELAIFFRRMERFSFN